MKKEKYAINPMTGEKVYRRKIIFVYGLEDDELVIVNDCLPSKDIEICDCTDCFTDIIAMSHIAVIINPSVMTSEHIDYFNSYAEDVGAYPEKHIFTQDHVILGGLSSNVKYSIFQFGIEFEDKLKYLLLDASKVVKRSESYSDTIAQTIRVLSEIRKNPGITTAELSDIIERNPRTVQRYITTLNCAGEFIEYDKKKKGWFLWENKSSLWGDC